MKYALRFIAVGVVSAAFAGATPPLVSGNVPTTAAGNLKIYTGLRYQDTGRVERQSPHAELIYGLNARWEVSVECNYLTKAGRRGLDDCTLTTKTVLAPETASRPALGASYEYNSDSADAARGFGSGGVEHDLRLRAQKTLGWVTPIVNFGRVLTPDARIAGVTTPRQDAWRASTAQEWLVAKPLQLLTEIYWRSPDVAGNPARLGWNIGFKHKLRDDLAWHGAIGGSLRDGDRGGPNLRLYIGVKCEFAAPWRPRVQ